VNILFAEDAADAFAEVPADTQRRIARSLELVSRFPRMYPRGRRGIMHGYRFFLAGRHLVYYAVSGNEIRVSAIVPAVMRRA